MCLYERNIEESVIYFLNKNEDFSLYILVTCQFARKNLVLKLLKIYCFFAFSLSYKCLQSSMMKL